MKREHITCPTVLRGTIVATETEDVTFEEVDEALYRHNTPLYRYAASGAGSNPAENEDWVLERKRLNQLWWKLCPWRK